MVSIDKSSQYAMINNRTIEMGCITHRYCCRKTKPMKILNSFSLNMLQNLDGEVTHKVIPLEEAKEWARVGVLESTVGHADTAAIFGSQLGMDVPAVRSTISLPKGELVLVGQYRGPRLAEGAKELPQGASIVWILLTVK